MIEETKEEVEETTPEVATEEAIVPDGSEVGTPEPVEISSEE